MNFVKKDLPVIVAFILLCAILWFFTSLLSDGSIKFKLQTILSLFVMVVLAVFAFFRGHYKKWIPNKKDLEDLTKNKADNSEF